MFPLYAAPLLVLSDMSPEPEATTPAAGAASVVSRGDHTHPRPSSVRLATTDANGKATIVFTRQFTAPPGTVFTAIENSVSYAPAFKVLRWLKQDGTTWTSAADGLIYGAEVAADRNQPLPTLTALTLVTFVLSGVNALFGLLSGYQTRTPAINVQFSYIAVMQS